ncbi:MAG: hypothetical protein ACI9EF_002196 [Pseudohongiellaceae bacterium]|jgi:hypothetical protein
MASAPRWCQIETTNRIRISGFVEDSATKSWRHQGLLGSRGGLALIARTEKAPGEKRTIAPCDAPFLLC